MELSKWKDKIRQRHKGVSYNELYTDDEECSDSDQEPKGKKPKEQKKTKRNKKQGRSGRANNAKTAKIQLQRALAPNPLDGPTLEHQPLNSSAGMVSKPIPSLDSKISSPVKQQAGEDQGLLQELVVEQKLLLKNLAGKNPPIPSSSEFPNIPRPKSVEALPLPPHIAEKEKERFEDLDGKLQKMVREKCEFIAAVKLQILDDNVGANSYEADCTKKRGRSRLIKGQLVPSRSESPKSPTIQVEEKVEGLSVKLMKAIRETCEKTLVVELERVDSNFGENPSSSISQNSFIQDSGSKLIPENLMAKQINPLQTSQSLNIDQLDSMETPEQLVAEGDKEVDKQNKDNPKSIVSQKTFSQDSGPMLVPEALKTKELLFQQRSESPKLEQVGSVEKPEQPVAKGENKEGKQNKDNPKSFMMQKTFSQDSGSKFVQENLIAKQLQPPQTSQSPNIDQLGSVKKYEQPVAEGEKEVGKQNNDNPKTFSQDSGPKLLPEPLKAKELPFQQRPESPKVDQLDSAEKPEHPVTEGEKEVGKPNEDNPKPIVSQKAFSQDSGPKLLLENLNAKELPFQQKSLPPKFEQLDSAEKSVQLVAKGKKKVGKQNKDNPKSIVFQKTFSQDSEPKLLPEPLKAKELPFQQRSEPQKCEQLGSVQNTKRSVAKGGKKVGKRNKENPKSSILQKTFTPDSVPNLLPDKAKELPFQQISEPLNIDRLISVKKAKRSVGQGRKNVGKRIKKNTSPSVPRKPLIQYPHTVQEDDFQNITDNLQTHIQPETNDPQWGQDLLKQLGLTAEYPEGTVIFHVTSSSESDRAEKLKDHEEELKEAEELAKALGMRFCKDWAELGVASNNLYNPGLDPEIARQAIDQTNVTFSGDADAMNIFLGIAEIQHYTCMRSGTKLTLNIDVAKCLEDRRKENNKAEVMEDLGDVIDQMNVDGDNLNAAVGNLNTGGGELDVAGVDLHADGDADDRNSADCDLNTGGSGGDDLNTGGKDLNSGGGGLNTGGGDLNTSGGDLNDGYVNNAGGDNLNAAGGDLIAAGGDLSTGGGDLNAAGDDFNVANGELNAGGDDLNDVHVNNAGGGILNAAGLGDLNAAGGDLSTGGGDLNAAGDDFNATGGDFNVANGEFNAGGDDLNDVHVNNAGGSNLNAAGLGNLDGAGGDLNASEGNLNTGGGELNVVGGNLNTGGGELNVNVHAGDGNFEEDAASEPNTTSFTSPGFRPCTAKEWDIFYDDFFARFGYDEDEEDDVDSTGQDFDLNLLDNKETEDVSTQPNSDTTAPEAKNITESLPNQDLESNQNFGKDGDLGNDLKHGDEDLGNDEHPENEQNRGKEDLGNDESLENDQNIGKDESLENDQNIGKDEPLKNDQNRGNVDLGKGEHLENDQNRLNVDLGKDEHLENDQNRGKGLEKAQEGPSDERYAIPENEHRDHKGHPQDTSGKTDHNIINLGVKRKDSPTIDEPGSPAKKKQKSLTSVVDVNVQDVSPKISVGPKFKKEGTRENATTKAKRPASVGLIEPERKKMKKTPEHSGILGEKLKTNLKADKRSGSPQDPLTALMETLKDPNSKIFSTVYRMDQLLMRHLKKLLKEPPKDNRKSRLKGNNVQEEKLWKKAGLFSSRLLMLVNKLFKIDNLYDLYKFEHYNIATQSQEGDAKWDYLLIKLRDYFKRFVNGDEQVFEALKQRLLNQEVRKYAGEAQHTAIKMSKEQESNVAAVATVADGRCFYHAVALNLISQKDSETNIADLFKILLAHDVLTKGDKYAPVHSSKDQIQCILRLLSTHGWADNMIMQYMSCFLERKIRSYRGFLDVEKPKDTTDLDFDAMKNDKYPVLIAYVGNTEGCPIPNHYVALLLRDKYSKPPEFKKLIINTDETITID